MMWVYLADGTTLSPHNGSAEVEPEGVYWRPRGEGYGEGMWMLIPWHRIDRVEGRY